jgi:hypothetical protein
VLKAYQSVTNTCGMLDCPAARDAYLHSLTDFSLPRLVKGRYSTVYTVEYAPYTILTYH